MTVDAATRGAPPHLALEADVTVGLGSFELAVELRLAPGETVALVGPNGAGKTTLLKALAGLRPLSAGRVVLGGTVLDDPRSGTYRPPEHRAVAVVFQEHRLFPHLSVLDNVAFGLRARGARRAAATARATTWLERVGLADRARARPNELSSGQAQRVALARALATEPALLLLDEPLAALDATTRADVRRDLRAHLAAFPGARLLVTHDPVDAAVLADRVVVLDAGRVTQVGTPAEITARPRTPWVAALAGTNLYAGAAAGAEVALHRGGALAVAGDGAHGEVFAVVHPRAVALHRSRPDGAARNTWPGRVASLEPVGDRVRVRVRATPPITAELTAAGAAALALTEGSDVWVAVKATEVDVYPA